MSDRSALLGEFGFGEEETEILRGQWDKTGFPQPIKTYRLMLEVNDLSLEGPYFWILDMIKDTWPKVIKLEDSFAAAENSAFFGVTQQRLGVQQDKISQFLATTGKMIKELFQMVRELRIIDERLDYYEDVAKETEKPLAQRAKSADITLKGFFVDLVQGGGKSAASVYGMARELEFLTLPDLFFDAPPFRNPLEIENHVNSLEKDFNRNVLRVLVRHLRQYYEWRIRTHAEHKSRRNFMLTYLEQHYQIINMYISWIKPYLRNVNKLSLKDESMESADIVSAFETSMLDIEVLGVKPEGKANSCVLATFQYRTRPELKVVSEGYQRGPVHIGRMFMELRAYTWSNEEVQNYKKLKERENLMLFGRVSSSVEKAMNSLGDVLEKYLEEARGLKEGKPPEKEKKQEQKSSLSRPRPGLFSNPQRLAAKKARQEAQAKKLLQNAIKVDKDKAFGHAYNMTWLMYKNFKKAYRMIQW